ncbi:MAG TPA: Gfo/Idh/MocA family oxidoreductase [Gaiellaceae bacterium]|nr:Gfo/Idh/MocA family oxidoreductase [Gaiellaceae bacterium]
MRAISDLKAAVVGTGFIGLVHVEALRRLGVEVTGVVGSSPERAREKARSYPLPSAYDSLEQALADPQVDVVHLTTPNHLHYPQVKEVLAAGKHCVCEKPLALSSAESAELLRLAERSGLVHCTNFNIRFYPQVQEARLRVGRGDAGDVWNVHGGYLQDWLLLDTDWNWRLDPAAGGKLRAVGDIGSHWLDLAQFVTGLRVESVLADLATTIPVRQRPTGPVETFTAATGETEPVEMQTEDLAHLLLRFEGGARGSCVVSQVSAGRRNRVSLEVDGSAGAIAWDSERNEELWLGHRGRPNETLWRDPGLNEGPVRGSVPAGHHEGFADTFKELYAAVYRAVAAGEPGDDYPTFRDGHWENVLADAVLVSNDERRWVQPHSVEVR